MRPIVYLACPYTHPDPRIRETRYRSVTVAAAKLVEKGMVVFSPITMTHPLDLLLSEEGATLGSSFWVEFDEAFMAACAEIVVLMLDGWDRSSGVLREIDYFQRSGKPVSYIDPSTLDIQ